MTQQPPRHVWLDVDAGVDDAQAIMLCLAAPGVEIVGISCVAGNVALQQVLVNVARILSVCRRNDVPFYAGADGNLLGRPRVETLWHGEDGLGDFAYHAHGPHCPQPQPQSAVTALVDAANNDAKPLTVVALGPLTNVALACRIAPDFPSKVSLVVMGGAITARGNQGPASEFNFECDPEAASICLRLFPTVTLLPWELMLKHTLPWERVEAWTSRENERSTFLRHMLEKVAAREKERGDDFVACDPVALAVALEPTLVTAATMVHVAVELAGEVTRGQSVVDWHGVLKDGRKSVRLVEGVDMERFCVLMDRCVK